MSAPLSVPSGTAAGGAQATVVVRVPNNLRPGKHTLGSVTVEVTGQGTEIRGNRVTVPVTVHVIHGGQRVRLPFVATQH